MESKRKFELPPRQEAIAFVILAAMTLILRVNQISADPPVALTTSQEVFTDPAQYTSFARNLALWGSFNPLHDYRLIFFLKSAMTAVSYLVFKIIGVGYVQSNLVGLLFSFSTIMLLYFALRKAAGNIAALFFLVFISVDINQIYYGRLSFLENSMNFFAILSFTILIFAARTYAFALAGIFLGAGIFFSKMVGAIYLFPFACFSVYTFFHDYRTELRKYLSRYLAFVIGFLVILIFWYFFSYRPASSSVSGYLQEQAVDLYGAPHAFKSPVNFIYQYISFGAGSKLFSRMVIPALLAWGMVLIFFFRAGFREAWKNRLCGITPGVLFLIALTLAAHGSLMIWNYRPMRYQTMLIYPLCALAGVFISMIIQGMKTGLKRMGWILFPAAFYILALPPVYQLIMPWLGSLGSNYYFVEAKSPLLLVTLALTALVSVLMYAAPASIFSPPRWVRNIFILLAVALAVIPNSLKYLEWTSAATYTTIANSKDLATILSPEAVVSGPYAADFTQNNRLRNLIHMFGVASVDSAFFRRYPVTHLILDKSNESYAEENYPDIMKNAVSIVRYRIGGRTVTLYRVAYITGNLEAGGYKMSPFEMAQYLYSQKDIVGGNSFMKKYLQKYPDNVSANLFSAVLAFDTEFYKEADYFFKKAIEFSPTDFHLRFKLGEYYIKMYKITGRADLQDKAMAEFALARKLNPESTQLVEEIDKLLIEKDPADVE